MHGSKVDEIDGLVVVIVDAAEGGQGVLDGSGACVDFHVYVLGFHARGVEFEDFEFGGDTLGGVECEHIGFEVGHLQRYAVGIGQWNQVDYFADESVGVLHEAPSLDEPWLSADLVNLESAGEVFG